MPMITSRTTTASTIISAIISFLRCLDEDSPFPVVVNCLARRAVDRPGPAPIMGQPRRTARPGADMDNDSLHMHYVCTREELKGIVDKQRRFWISDCGCRTGSG